MFWGWHSLGLLGRVGNDRSMRLDEDVWTCSALGTVGPHGGLSDVAGGGRCSYRPLSSLHLAPGVPAEPRDRMVHEVRDESRWSDLTATAVTGGALPTPRFDDPGAGVVVVTDVNSQHVHAIVCGAIRRDDPRIGHVTSLWWPNLAWMRSPIAPVVMGTAFTVLFRSFASRGAVGVMAHEAWFGPDALDALHDIGGFRPMIESYLGAGLAPSDASWTVCRWAASVADDRVVTVVTDPPLQGDAHRLLLQLLRVQLPDVAQGTRALEPVDDRYRLTMSGQIRIDGTTGVGDGGPLDWYDHEPDTGDTTIARPRARHALGRWIDDQLALRA